MSETAIKPGEVEKVSDYGEGAVASVRRWLAEIKAYEGTFSDWTRTSQRIVKKYRSERSTSENEFVNQDRKMNLFWSNVQTMQPALFSRTPQPDVSRTHKDRDPVGRASAIILQRVLSNELVEGGLEEAAKCARDDYLLTARGQAWVRYVPTYGDEMKDAIPLQAELDGDNITLKTEDGETYEGETEVIDQETGEVQGFGEPYRPVVDECVKIDHILWSDFGHTPAPKWSKVRAVWKRELMTREQLVKRFGPEIGKEVSLTKSVGGIAEEVVKAFGDVFMRGEVYEIWDKTTKKVIWVSPGYIKGPLDMLDDPLNLRNFFPCPKPLFGTLTTDSLIPVPDYSEYRTQANEIDTLTQRISVLTKALRAAGCYNSEFESLEKLLDGGENTMIPVEGWMSFAESGGIEGQTSFLPIKEIAEVLTLLVNAREQQKQDLYEVTGIADIVRGQSDPRETLGAQEIKGRYAGIRLSERQSEMARFVKDVTEIAGEIVAEMYSEDTLLQQSGWMETNEAEVLQRNGIEPRMIFEQAVELIRDDRMRGYRIEISTDQMILQDDEREKREKLEFLGHASSFMREAVPAAQQFPAIGPLLSEMLMFGVRSFKMGRSIEANFEEAIHKMASVQKPPEQEEQGQQGPTPAEEEATLMKAQAEMMKAKSTQDRAMIEAQKVERDGAIEEMRLMLQNQQAEIDKMRAAGEEQQRQFQNTLEIMKLRQSSAETIAEMEDRSENRAVQREQIAAQKEVARQRGTGNGQA